MPMDTLAFLLFCLAAFYVVAWTMLNERLGEHGRGRGPIAIRREEPAAARRARGAPGG
jgi:hypothetical protein